MFCCSEQGGEVAGNARKDAEEKIGKNIVSEDNFFRNSRKNKEEKNKKLK